MIEIEQLRIIQEATGGEYVGSVEEWVQIENKYLSDTVQTDRKGITFISELIKEDKSLNEEELKWEWKLMSIQGQESLFSEKMYEVEKILMGYDRNPMEFAAFNDF